MRYPFFVRSALVVGSALALYNCDDETIANAANQFQNGEIIGQVSSSSISGIITPASSGAAISGNTITVTEASWILNADKTYLISTGLVVSDAKGSLVGTYDQATMSIKDASGNVVIANIDLNTLQVVTPGETITVIFGSTPVAATSSAATVNPALSSASVLPVASSASVIPSLSSAAVVATSSNSQQQAKSSNSQQQAQSSASQQGSEGKCLNSLTGEYVAYYTEQVGKNGEKFAFKNDCSIDCWWDGSNSNCANIGTASSNNNQQQAKSSSSQQQQQPKSSSSKQQQAKSSSSQAKSSSSQQQQQQGNGGSLLPKIVDNNKKSGYATRYWDSCKPHCAWEGKGGPVARTCSTDGVTTIGSGASSVCDNGGEAGTCFDQAPQIVNDTIAYAFAATPGGGNDCGKCYMLTFKGTGASATNTPTDSHHRAIKGKHLIVMASNIGYDVSNNQFDLMIPGGGPGAFNGCSRMGISCAGATYGGFLTTCNYDKSCLIKMCNSEYANNANLKNGCLFLANWMDAANNPEVEYVQVECPAALEAKY